MKKDVLTRILAVLAALAVWQLAAMSVGSRILLASPWQALGRLLALLRRGFAALRGGASG